MGHLDSHCHLDDERFAPDLARVATRARDAGVTRVIVPGVTLDALDSPFPDLPGLAVHRAGGLHPAFPHPEDALEALERVAREGRIMAIGECGLDKRFRTPGDLAHFTAQLDLARAHDLPVILHVVHLHEEVLGALRARPGLRGVVHAFAGPWSVAKRYLDLGLALGLGGIATWETANRLHETIQRCPPDGFVLETDAPDLAPAWRRGERNEPAELVGIAQAIAARRGTSPEEVLAASDATGSRIFGV